MNEAEKAKLHAEMKERAQAAVHALDLIQAGLHGLAGGDFAGAF